MYNTIFVLILLGAYYYVMRWIVMHIIVLWVLLCNAFDSDVC